MIASFSLICKWIKIRSKKWDLTALSVCARRVIYHMLFDSRNNDEEGIVFMKRMYVCMQAKGCRHIKKINCILPIDYFISYRSQHEHHRMSIQSYTTFWTINYFLKLIIYSISFCSLNLIIQRIDQRIMTALSNMFEQIIAVPPRSSFFYFLRLYYATIGVHRLSLPTNLWIRDNYHRHRFHIFCEYCYYAINR